MSLSLLLLLYFRIYKCVHCELNGKVCIFWIIKAICVSSLWFIASFVQHCFNSLMYPFPYHTVAASNCWTKYCAGVINFCQKWKEFRMPKSFPMNKLPTKKKSFFFQMIQHRKLWFATKWSITQYFPEKQSVSPFYLFFNSINWIEII